MTSARLPTYIPLRIKLGQFAKARAIRNALDRTRLRQANRLFAGKRKHLTKVDFMTLETKDITANRVFQDGRLDSNEPITSWWSFRYFVCSRRRSSALSQRVLSAGAAQLASMLLRPSRAQVSISKPKAACTARILSFR